MSVLSTFMLDGRHAIVCSDTILPEADSICHALTTAGANVRRASSDAVLKGETGIGRIDILVFLLPSLGDRPIEACDKAIVAEATGAIEQAFLVSQAAASKMVTQGESHRAIIHVASPLARVGAIGQSIDAMTAHAIRGLVAASALELGPHGICVNLLEADIGTTHERALSHAPNHEDLGSAVVYLASPAARAMTGTSLVIDAGWTAR